MTEPATLLLTSREAAAQLAIGESTLRALVRRGELATVRLGRALRFDPDDLRELIARQRVGARPVGLSTDLAPAVALETTPPPADPQEGGASEGSAHADVPAEGRTIGASLTRENEAPTGVYPVGARASSKGHSRDSQQSSTGAGGVGSFWHVPTRTRDRLGVTP